MDDRGPVDQRDRDRLVAPVGAFEAARTFARRAGLPLGEMAVLKDGSNLVVHLRPAPVVLRVATLTAVVRGDPLPYLQREMDLVSYLSAAGAPVMAPSDLVAPGPHVVDGWALSAFRLVPGMAPGHPDVHTAFATLGELHRALRSYPGGLPVLSPAADDFDRAIAYAIGEGLLAGGEAGALTERRDALLAELLAAALDRQPLHGDAFARNALNTADGVIWIDFEDCCSGPVIWDLGVMVERDPDAGLIAHIGRQHGAAVLATAMALREVQAAAWSPIHAALIRKAS